MALNQGELALYVQIGERVREAREAAKLTQQELGGRIRLSRASVTNIEKARQSVQVHTLYAIAGALQVPITALLPDDVAVQEIATTRLARAFSNAKGVSAEEKIFIEGLIAPTLTPKKGQDSR